jgi:uncharacterized membrane protein
MKLACQNGTQVTHKPLLPTPDGVGALEVQLTCDCEILIPGRRPVRPPYPCPSTLLKEPMTHIIIPSIMSRIDVVLQSTKMAPSHFTSYANLSACFNETWDLGTPKINISAIADLERLRVPDIVHMLPSGTSALMIIWNLILTALLLFLGFKVCGGSGVAVASWLPMLNMPRAEAFTPEAIQSEITVLLVLIIILDLVVLAVACGAIYFCVIKRKMQEWRVRYVTRKGYKQSLEGQELQNLNRASRDNLELTMRRGETRNVSLDENPCINITVRDSPVLAPHGQ